MFELDGIEVHCTDVLAWAIDYKKRIEAGKVMPIHCFFTDPPYGLGDPPPIEELLRAWLDYKDYDTGVGFMGTHWDVVPGPHIWRAFLDITHPGGYLFAYGGTRTVDLLSMALRLGGWEPFDRAASFGWIFGSGFPKSLAIGKALDREAGAERKVTGKYQPPNGQKWNLQQADDDSIAHAPGAFTASGTRTLDITAPATPLAARWEGYGTALKPAVEYILCFRKPRAGRTFAQCAREFGSGGLDVDAGRVKSGGNVAGTSRSHSTPQEGWDRPWRHDKEAAERTYAAKLEGNRKAVELGRFPPNATFSHVPPSLCATCHGEGMMSTADIQAEYDLVGIPEWVRCPTCKGEGVTGGCRRVGSERVKGNHPGTYRREQDRAHDTAKERGWGYRPRKEGYNVNPYADADGRELVEKWDCIEGECPVWELARQSGESKSPGNYKRKTAGEESFKHMYAGGRPLPNEHIGHGDSGTAARYFHNHDWQLDIEEMIAGAAPFRYCAKSSRSEREAGCSEMPRQFLATMGDGIGEREHNENEPKAWVGNNHPTVKPLALNKWLAALLKPPDEYEPILAVPFAGSGSEIIGAMLVGWKHIIGIEREQEYHTIAAARIEWWHKWQRLTSKSDPAEIRRLALAGEKDEREARDDGQLSLFK
ncbi:MAG: site-specific DNA-methyltransferase [Chloroflexi bacterium]|nr:site-specific DNA-methyltransferase [Chloroflexota bacterium]